MRNFTEHEKNIFLIETASKIAQLKTELYCTIQGLQCYVAPDDLPDDLEYTDEAFEISNNYYEEAFKELSNEFL